MEFYEETSPMIPRVKPMKVLVLSLPRTGTTSICEALRKLGLNPYHFSEISKNKNNRHFQLWLRAVQAKYDGLGEPFRGEDFDRMLWNYDAVTDDPCCLFVEELVAAYPNAKIILTTRTPEAWLRSMQGFILEILSWRSWTPLCLFDREFTAPYQALLNRTTRVLSQGHPPCHPSARPALLESLDNHSDRVRRAASSPQRLLEFHPSQGWGPLCEFLDLPIPEGPYPHLNGKKEALQLEKSLYWARWGVVVRQIVRKTRMAAFVFAIMLWVFRRWVV